MLTHEGYLFPIKQHASAAIMLLVHKLAYHTYYIIIKLYTTSKGTQTRHR